jgi:hypothetical protein
MWSRVAGEQNCSIRLANKLKGPDGARCGNQSMLRTDCRLLASEIAFPAISDEWTSL